MNGPSIVKVVRRVHVSDAPYSNGVHCGGGGCPAVFETDQGTFPHRRPAPVGRREGGAAHGPDRDALEVPRDLLTATAARLQVKEV